ncbi:hypothetical protein [Photobacterium leiognathi]|nr:hypothetical protein [Photobacterium leiognathi]
MLKKTEDITKEDIESAPSIPVLDVKPPTRPEDPTKPPTGGNWW